MSDSKRRKFETLFPKLKKLFGHLDNPNDGERENAISAITRLLKQAGLDWRDFGTLFFAATARPSHSGS